VPAGAAVLALRTGAPILPAAFLRDPDGDGYVAYVGQPLTGGGSGRSPAEIQALTQRIMTWLEEIIVRFPDQWYMFRPMWPALEAGPQRTSPLGGWDSLASTQ
jgi:KDO2-lipid IV(A) lauroyltransferase